MDKGNRVDGTEWTVEVPTADQATKAFGVDKIRSDCTKIAAGCVLWIALKGSGAPRKKGDRLSVSKNWIFSFKFESQLPLSKRVSKTVLRLGTCGTHMGILPESTDSLKTSYFSRESTFRTSDFSLEVKAKT